MFRRRKEYNAASNACGLLVGQRARRRFYISRKRRALGRGFPFKDIAAQRISYRRSRVIGGERIFIGFDAAIEIFRELADLARDRKVADPHLAQRIVHILKHGVEQALARVARALELQRVLRFQPPHQQIDMQRHHLKPPIERVRNAKPCVKRLTARLLHRGREKRATSLKGRVISEKPFEHVGFSCRRQSPAPLTGRPKHLRQIAITGIEKAIMLLSRRDQPFCGPMRGGARGPAAAANERIRERVMVRLLLLALAFASIQACVSVRSSHGYVLERDQSTLDAEPGFDTKDSILAKYGEPSMIGVFDRNSWYYLFSADQARAFFRPETTARTVVAIKFDEGSTVASVEKFNLEDGDNIKMVSRETPTRGKTLNFWEQLLGNVGALPSALGQEGPVPGQ